MTDFGARATCRYRVGIAAVLLALWAAPGVAQPAGGWAAFEARCLAPWTVFEAARTADLAPAGTVDDGDVQYHALPGGADRLAVERAPADGRRACHLVNPSGDAEAAFDRWIAQQEQRRRYLPAGPGRWHSNRWIEPVLAIEKRRDEGGALILRILETTLES